MNNHNQMNSLDHARRLHLLLKLPLSNFPMNTFGSNSAYGKVFLTRNGRIMKIAPSNANLAKEVNLGRTAGQAGFGPKIHNFHNYTIKTNADRVMATALFPNVRLTKLGVVIMNKVPHAASYYNAVNSGMRNWPMVQKAINAMHAAGIHHGDLHGENILIEHDAAGKAVRAWVIDFGTSHHNKAITNITSAVRIALAPGTVTRIPPSRHSGRAYSLYSANGKRQLVVSNKGSVASLKTHMSDAAKQNRLKSLQKRLWPPSINNELQRLVNKYVTNRTRSSWENLKTKVGKNPGNIIDKLVHPNKRSATRYVTNYYTNINTRGNMNNQKRHYLYHSAFGARLPNNKKHIPNVYRARVHVA
jgi:hypothetical protein